MLRKLLIIFAVIVAILVGAVMTRPSTFHVERSTSIAAAPDAVFAQVNDFHAWAAWSPWGKLDPAMKTAYEGPASGVGAIYRWAGNNDVGEGKMTIEKSEKPSQIAIRIDFEKPFAATNSVLFSFVPGAGGTKVTWAMDGRNNFASKLFSLFMNMDQLIGGNFETGLAAMKGVVEGTGTSTAKSAPSSK